MATCRPANCTSWGDLQPNSEIAGIGVITGFVATAYITLLMVIVHYLFDHNEATNPVDRVIIDGVARLWKLLIADRAKPSLKWSEAIEAAVLMFSDQQIVTGIGILVSGYTQINCALSTYHWQIVVYLAWFSSLTHLTTLTALRPFFRGQPTLAYWRVFFMGCTITLLATALGPTGYMEQGPFSIPVALPALCLFSSSGAREAFAALETQNYPYPTGYALQFNWPLITLSLLFLFASYVSRVIGLFTPTAEAALYHLRTKRGYNLKKTIIHLTRNSNTSRSAVRRAIWATGSLLYMTFYVLLKVVFDIGQSMFWEIFWLIAALAWGTIRLLTTWSSAHLSEENIWGFGQVMALLLIALPFLSLSEQLFTKSKEPSLYPNHTPALSRVNTHRTTIRSSPNLEDPEVLTPFVELQLEKQNWYRKLGLLTFGMAIVIAADLLFDFPAAPLTRYSFGTSGLNNYFAQFEIEYVIFFGFIGFILFMYTAISLIFDRNLLQYCCRYIFGKNSELQKKVLNIIGYIVVFLLLAGTMIFDIFLFYYPYDALSNAYAIATAPLGQPYY